MSIPLQMNASNISNASSSLAGSFGDTSVLIGMLFAVVITVIVLLASTRAYLWAIEAAGYFAQSVEYALKGVLTAAIITIFAAPFYLVAQLDAADRQLLAVAAGVIVAGYVALVVLGFIGEAVWGLIKRRHVEATGHEPFEDPEEEA